MNLGKGLLKAVFVLFPYLLHARFAVESLPDHFVGLHKLVNFASQFVVLVAHNSDVTVH